MSSRTVSISIPLPGRLPVARTAWLAAGLLLGLVTAVALGPLLAARPMLAVDGSSSPTPEHTISVTGTGTITLSPDTADLRLGVSKTAATVKAARDAAAASMSAVVAALKKVGIADADIQTTTLSLQPQYDYSYNANPPHLTGYVLSNEIAVTIHDLTKVADAIDDSLAAGATTLDGVSFRVADQASAEKQARQAAMAEAATKAKTLADAAGISLGAVASISETVAPIPYPVYYGAAAAGAPDAKSVPTPVQPGTNDVTVTVDVTYLIP